MDLSGLNESEVTKFIKAVVVTSAVAIVVWELLWFIGRHVSLGWG
jgi:hypothetical protein